MSSSIAMSQVSALSLQFTDQLGNLYCQYTYEPAHQLSIIHWRGFLEVESLIATYIQIGNFCKANRYVVTRAISDLSEVDGSFYRLNDWLANDLLPKMVRKYGFRYSALVKPKEICAELTLEEHISNVEGMCTSRIFDSFDHAYHWVTSQP